MIMNYVIGCSIIVGGIVGYFWVRSMSNTKEKQAEYREEAEFDEWDNIYTEGDF